MKSLTLLIFAVGCTTAFGQMASTPSNSNGFREYASDAIAVAYLNPSETGNSNAPAVTQDFESILKQSDNPNSQDLSIADIQAILENKISMSERASSEMIEVKSI